MALLAPPNQLDTYCHGHIFGVCTQQKRVATPKILLFNLLIDILKSYAYGE